MIRFKNDSQNRSKQLLEDYLFHMKVNSKLDKILFNFDLLSETINSEKLLNKSYFTTSKRNSNLFVPSKMFTISNTENLMFDKQINSSLGNPSISNIQLSITSKLNTSVIPYLNSNHQSYDFKNPISIGKYVQSVLPLTDTKWLPKINSLSIYTSVKNDINNNSDLISNYNVSKDNIKINKNDLFPPKSITSSSNIYNYFSSFPSDINPKILEPEKNLNIDQTMLNYLTNIDKPSEIFIKTTNGISNQLGQKIGLLLNELKNSKELNLKLQNQIKSLEKELNDLREAMIKKDTQIQFSQTPERISGIIGEIYRAQKTRDTAIIERLKDSNNERDAALLQCTLLQQQLHINDNSVDNTFHQLVKSKSVQDLKIQSGQLVDMIKQQKQKKHTETEREIEMVLYEKDIVTQLKDKLESRNLILEEKLNQALQEAQEAIYYRMQLEQDKDEYEKKCSFLENELENLKIYYNLHGSLTQESDLKQEYSNTVESLQMEIHDRNVELERLESQKLDLIEKLNEEIQGNLYVKSKQQSLELELNREKDKSERLQRLVNVLRRKINDVNFDFEEISS